MRTDRKKDVLSIVTIALLIVIAATGALSLDFSKSYEITSQYGDTVKMYGNGIYAHDSYFAAPIFIGTDVMILFIFVPLFIYTHFQNAKESTNITKLKLMSVYAVACYYAASLCFGVTYNRYHLLYIGLFSCTLFGLFSIMRDIEIERLNHESTAGIRIFLILSGVALIVAWVPDIVQAAIANTAPPGIDVYTTSTENVLDMGIIGPLFFVCLHLLIKRDKLGIVILASLLKTCIVVGIMMITQTVCQMLSGFELTLPVLVTKSGSFLLLGGFAWYFNSRLYAGLESTSRSGA